MHYRRFRATGHVDRTKRPSDWGKRSGHPLWHTWKWIAKHRIGREPRWDDFWVFVEDVVARPSDKHQLRRYDPSKPFSRDNCYWHYRLTNGDMSRSEAQKAMRSANPLGEKNRNLQKKYGITLADYDTMLRLQKRVCAICKRHSPNPNFGLAVDHCHTTKKVRGLLCTNCNRGIGHFADDPARLREAALYLERANHSRQ